MGWSEESRKSAGIRLKQKIRTGEFPHYEGGFKGPHRQDSKQKMSEARILLWRDQNYLNKMAERNSIISRITKEKWEDPNYKKRVSKKISDAMEGKAFSEQHKQSLREAPRRSSNSELQRGTASKLLKKKWTETPESILKSLTRRPTKLELQFNFTLQTWFPNKWKYVGDFSFWVPLIEPLPNGTRHLNPDWKRINSTINGKKLIELNGQYYHDNEDPQIRIGAYAKVGWECLVIWWYELGDPDSVKSRIRDFMYAT